MSKPRAFVYVDGFNLFYRCLKGTPHKWLDVGKLCQFILSDYDVRRIRYFTALVESRPNDPQQQQRQQAYIRALKTIPEVRVHYGSFMTNPVKLPLAAPAKRGKIKLVQVLRTEEKGSDVNLASYLLEDGFEDRYDTAVVISNDSDLKGPLRMVKKRGLQTGVIITDPKTRQSGLPADFHRRIRERQLQDCQFPDPVLDRQGRAITKPAGW